MKKKQAVWLMIIALFLASAVPDVARYLKPDASQKQTVRPYGAFPASSANELILVYNAWGGIYPGLADFVHKEAFPKTYPCNLCYQTFGTFGMKKEWKSFLAGLPYQTTELHKDEFRRLFTPESLPLPLILLRNGNGVQQLLSAAEINRCHSLNNLIQAAKTKLKR